MIDLNGVLFDILEKFERTYFFASKYLTIGLFGDYGYENIIDLPTVKEVNLDLAYNMNDAEDWLFKMSANLRRKK